MRRRLYVPGSPLPGSIIVSEAMRIIVLLVPHADEVVVVFIGGKPRAVSMSAAQAEKLKSDLRWIDQAFADDEKIAEMEAGLGE